MIAGTGGSAGRQRVWWAPCWGYSPGKVPTTLKTRPRGGPGAAGRRGRAASLSAGLACGGIVTSRCDNVP